LIRKDLTTLQGHGLTIPEFRFRNREKLFPAQKFGQNDESALKINSRILRRVVLSPGKLNTQFNVLGLSPNDDYLIAIPCFELIGTSEQSRNRNRPKAPGGLRLAFCKIILYPFWLVSSTSLGFQWGSAMVGVKEITSHRGH
jgi:hypothetical protein